MFDPEKVERHSGVISDANIHANEENADWVFASDYDALLQLYRDFVPAVPCYICGKEAKGSKCRTVETKEPVCESCWRTSI